MCVEQLNAMLADSVEGSAFYRPVTKFPDGISAADQARLKAAYAQAISSKVRPALTRMRDFIRDRYLPAARDSVGLQDMKGGPALYRYLVRSNTTTDLTPAAIHQIGLDEVQRLHREMETVKEQVGFKGTLQQFFEHIRTDPKFKPASREALQQGYVAIGKRLEATLPKLFSDAAQGAARNPPRACAHRKGRRARLVPAGHARRFPTRRVLLQRIRPAVAHHAWHGNALPARRRAGASLPDQPGAGE